MRYCEECGKELNDSELICPVCGAKQSDIQSMAGQCNMATVQSFTQAVALAQAGDNRGFEFLYNRTYKDKKYIALKYMKNETDAEDVLQDSYIKMMNKLNTLDNPEKFSSWFGLIVANTAKDALRKKNPVLFSQMEQENAEGEAMEFELQDEAIAVQPELSYTQKETQDLVREMMAALSDEQRVCIMMYYIEGMSVREIAEALECSENTVKSRLNYGRKNIKSQGEELQRKGYQLYGMAPLPLLIYLLRMEAGLFGANVATTAGAAAGVGQMAGAQAGQSVGQTAGAQAGQSVGQMAGAQAGQSVGQMAGAQAGQGVGQMAGAQAGQGVGQMAGAQAAKGAAGTTAKKGIFATLGGKIAVGIGALAIAGGIGFGIMTVVNKNKDEEPETSITDATELTTEVVTTEEPTTEVTTEEVMRTNRELFEEYIDEVLIPEKGMTSYDQKGYITYLTSSAVWPSYKVSGDWLNLNGIVKTDIYDYDGDGEEELLVLYVKDRDTSIEYDLEYDILSDYDGNSDIYFDNVMMMSVYEVEDQEVSFSEETYLPCTYYANQRFVTDEIVYLAEVDGHRYIVARRTNNDEAENIDAIYAYEYIDGKLCLCRAFDGCKSGRYYDYVLKTYDMGNPVNEERDGTDEAGDIDYQVYFTDLEIPIDINVIEKGEENVTPLYRSSVKHQIPEDDIWRLSGRDDISAEGYYFYVKVKTYSEEEEFYDNLVYVDSTVTVGVLNENWYEGDITYEIPQINLQSEEIDSLNAEIKAKFNEIIENSRVCETDNYAVPQGINYEWNYTKDVLSIVIKVIHRYSNQEDQSEYIIYNIDLNSNHVMTNDEVLTAFEMTKEEFDEVVKEAIKQREEIIGDLFLQESYSQENIDKAIPFVGQDGIKKLYATFLFNAGSGQGITFMYFE